MKKSLLRYSLVLAIGISLPSGIPAQEAGMQKIDIPDLESHLSVLAADSMEGRKTGERGLELAARYLAGKSREIGLEPAGENGGYFQHYTLVTKNLDPGMSSLFISHADGTGRSVKEPFYLLNPDSDTTNLNGELVFAGYGIQSDPDGYNDLADLNLEGKIVLVMNRGPLDKDGRNNLLSDRNWISQRSYQHKLPGLVARNPQAVLIVMDPKSKYLSLEEYSPRMARYLNRSRYVKELGQPQRGSNSELTTKVFFIHREAAEEILRPSGVSLAELQDSIDESLQPVSFEMPGSRIEISTVFGREEKSVPNVVGLVEGSDPELKQEFIIYTAHFDHLGLSASGDIYNGADDNASGTAALLEIGEAFSAVRKELKRSVMILWVSGEEIGLFGSRYYTEYPLVPLENTVANLNLDMVGAVRTQRDEGKIHGENISVLGMDSIGLIGGLQSSDLLNIHLQTAGELGLITDQSMNDPDHPYRYFYRSDQFNFASHDIPVLFYSTGVHADYHQITDDYDRINFTKLKKVSQLAFLVGYRLATRKESIETDNPFSGWGK